jgi:hypothetical protein
MYIEYNNDDIALFKKYWLASYILDDVGFNYLSTAGSPYDSAEASKYREHPDKVTLLESLREEIDTQYSNEHMKVKLLRSIDDWLDRLKG